MSINDIMREFDKGVADIEREKALKKQRSFVSPGIVSEEKAPEMPSRDWLMDEFDAGVKEIEQSRAKEKPSIAPVEYGKGFVSGVRHRLPEMVGQAGQAVGIEKAKKLTEWARKGEKPKEHGAFYQAGEMTPASVALPLTLGTAAKGVAMLPVPGARPVAAGLQVAAWTIPAIMFGLSQFQSTKEEAQKRGIDPGAAPYITGGIETAGETAGNYALTKLLGPLAPGIPVAKAGVKTLLKSSLFRAGKTLALKTVPTEVLTEMGQNWGETLTEKAYKVRPEAKPVEEAMSAIWPTVIMTLVGGGAATGIQRYQSKVVLDTLQDPNADIRKRQNAADTITGIILSQEEAENKPMAKIFHDYAVDRIAKKMPINIEKPVGEIKEEILNDIVLGYEKGEQDIDQTQNLIIEGYRNQLFDDKDLEKLSKKSPDLKDKIETIRAAARAGIVKDTLSEAIHHGLATGEFNGEEFTLDNAMGFIRSGLKNNIFTDEDVDEFKEKYPDLKHELNNLIAEKVVSDIDSEVTRFKPEPVVKTEKPADEYAIKDIEDTYLKAKERVRTEPVSLQELQERFKERQGREATEKEQNELNRIYEKAKRRSQQKKTFEEKRKTEEAPPKTKEELELEAYEPELPLGVTKVKAEQKAKPKAPVVKPGAKEPWEMTKKEYESSPYAKNKSYDVAVETWKDEGRKITPAYGKEPWDMSLPEFTKALNDGLVPPLGKMSGSEIIKDYDRYGRNKTQHRWAIKYALKEGKLTPEKYAEFHEKEYGPLDEFMPGIADKQPKIEPKEPKSGPKAFSILGEEISTHKNNIRNWFKEPANWENKKRLTYKEVAEKIAGDKDVTLKKEEIPIDTSKPLGKTKEKYVAYYDGKRLREFPKEVYDYVQEIVEKPKEPRGMTTDEAIAKEKNRAIEAEAKLIPEFKNTEEALAFGKTATPEQIKALKIKRDESSVKINALKSRGDIQGAMDEAVRGQFFREAIESAKLKAEPKAKTEVKSKAKDPVSFLLSSKKKAGVKYEMKVKVAETNEIITVTKDAGVALRETKEELDKMNKFLECLT